MYIVTDQAILTNSWVVHMRVKGTSYRWREMRAEAVKLIEWDQHMKDSVQMWSWEVPSGKLRALLSKVEQNQEKLVVGNKCKNDLP